MRHRRATLVAAAGPTPRALRCTASPGGSFPHPEGPQPGNGEDQGWGNCGHRSSVGSPHSGDAGSLTGTGNVGATRAQCRIPAEEWA